jgi:hypothetical protein
MGVPSAKLHQSEMLTSALSKVLDNGTRQMRISKFVDELHGGIISFSIPPMAGEEGSSRFILVGEASHLFKQMKCLLRFFLIDNPDRVSRMNQHIVSNSGLWR